MMVICATCQWFMAEESVCTNVDSRHCADFMGEYCGCEKWEEVKNNETKKRFGV